MIRIQETENEYLVFIPAAQKERARNIRPRDWDRRRVCWVYPRTEQIYKSLLAEFGNDPNAEFFIENPQSPVSQTGDEGQSREIQNLKNENCQLRVKIKSLFTEIERTAADREQKADDLSEKLIKKLQENAKLTKHNSQLKTENRKLTTAVKKSADDRERIERMASKVADKLRKREQENATLAEHNSQLKTENRKLTTAVKKSADDKGRMERMADKVADGLRKKEQENVKLTEQKARLKTRNTKLSDKIKSLESAKKEAMPAPKRKKATDPTNRPNKSALSDAIDIFRDTMRPFVIKNLKRVPGADVEEAIRRSLPDKQAADFNRGLRQHSDLASAIDVNFFPRLVTNNWRDTFSIAFKDERIIQSELWMISEARNDVSHPPTHDFEPDYTGAYLYIIADALERIKAPEQKQKVKKVREDWEKGLGWSH